MKQPTKDALREQLALAADEIIRLQNLMDEADDTVAFYRDCMEGMAQQRKPWWRRWFA